MMRHTSLDDSAEYTCWINRNNGSQSHKHLLENVSSNNMFNYILFISNNLESNSHPYLSKGNTKSFDGF